jgi:hypothetical protein
VIPEVGATADDEARQERSLQGDAVSRMNKGLDPKVSGIAWMRILGQNPVDDITQKGYGLRSAI